MFQLSQRCCTLAATLASVVLRLCVVAAVAMLALSCTSDVRNSQADVAAPGPSDVARSSVTEPARAPTADVPADTSPPSIARPRTTAPPEVEVQIEPANLSIADELPGLIVRRTGTGDIVTSAPNGSNEIVWGSGTEAINNQPTWSSDGSQLAWSVVDRQGASAARVEIQNGPGSIELLAVDSPAFYLSWSPDDRWLAGLRSGTGGLELTMLDTTAGTFRVVGPGQPFFTDWLTDDSLIAAIGGTVLADVPATSGVSPAQRELEEPLGLFQTPIALPDGDVIIAVRRGNSNDVVRLGEASVITLASSDGPVAFSADPLSERLAVLTVPSENELELISFQNTPTLEPGRVSIIDLRNGEVSTRPETGIIAVSWSPTGSRLAMLELSDSGTTWLFADPEDDTVLKSVPFLPSSEFANSYLPFADQYDRSSTWWSPDGTAFVFAGQALGRDGIWIDRIDDEKGPAFLGSGDIAFWSS